MSEIENKILNELNQLEKESESLLEGIDMNNLSEEDTEKVQHILNDMFNKIKDILEESNKLTKDIEDISIEEE